MTGKPGLDKILYLGGIVLTLASAALVYYSHNLLTPQRLDPSESFAQMARGEKNEASVAKVSLEEISVNLYSRKTRLRFLDLKADVSVYEDNTQQRVKDITPLIRDQIIDVAGNMSAEELNTVTGKILFESKIKKRLNEILGGRVIKRIYFSKFIVQ